MPNVLPDALADALGRVVADAQQRFQKDLEILLARTSASMAQADLAVLGFKHDLEASVREALGNLKNGVDGRDGRDGEPGPAGERGPPGESIRGERGEQGVPGQRGERGPPGEKGEKGDPGEKGEPGAPGEKGDKGDPGERGERGERGLPGAPGKIHLVRSYSDRVHYEGDLVAFAGATYQAQRDTGQSPPHADWICIAAKGEDGRSLKIRGTYDPGAEYRALDVVALNGGSFVCLQDGPGACPGEGWQLLTSPGKRGEKGLPGDRGPKGEPGQPGPTIISWKTDPDTYSATPVLSNGALGAPLDLRSFFERFHDETQR